MTEQGVEVGVGGILSVAVELFEEAVYSSLGDVGDLVEKVQPKYLRRDEELVTCSQYFTTRSPSHLADPRPLRSPSPTGARDYPPPKYRYERRVRERNVLDELPVVLVQDGFEGCQGCRGDTEAGEEDEGVSSSVEGVPASHQSPGNFACEEQSVPEVRQCSCYHRHGGRAGGVQEWNEVGQEKER